MSKNNTSIFLIDGNSLCYRAFYAIRALSTSKGRPTNAVYGFITMLRKMIREHSPGKIIVVFDMPGMTSRHKKYESYKIHRSPMPEDLVGQMDTIKEVIKAYNIPICQKEGYEADDIIATIAHRAREKGIDVVIVTGDKDALQLVGDSVKVLSAHTSGEKIYDAGAVKDKFGVVPERMVELMGLMGDQSDNIPGVKGVGKITAGKLINKYGSIKGVYENLPDISSDILRKKLSDGRENAFLSRELAKLQYDVPVDIDLDDCRQQHGADMDALARIFKELEFGKLLKEIAPVEDPLQTLYHGLSCKADDRVLEMLRSSGTLSFSFFAGGPEGDIRGVSFSSGRGTAVYIPLHDKDGKSLAMTVLGSERVCKIGHNIKETIGALSGTGMELNGELFDVMIADYVADPSLSRYELQDIAMRREGYNLFPGKRKTSGPEHSGDAGVFSDDPATACERSDMIMRLYGPLSEELEQKGLASLFHDIEMPLVKVIADIEKKGVGIDLVYLKKKLAELENELKNISARVFELAGIKFNINSPKQLQEILYVKLGLPPGRKTKTGLSTDEESLKKLSSGHELPGVLLRYREMHKLKTAYYDSIIQMTDKNNARLHARFNQTVTATGRLSSSEPNLQNIPIKTPVGREIRRAFVPRSSDYVLIAADYSQVELRVLAHLSGDTSLIRAFKDQEDIHTFTASLIYGCPKENVTVEMRSAAKTVNFGIIYGMGSFGLSKDLGISVEEADDFISAYFKRYQGVSGFIDRTLRDARSNGYVSTLLNRRRYIPEIKSGNERIRSFAERAAVNTVVQGTAADIIKIAMIKCHDFFRETDTDMIIQVHDELVFESPVSGMTETALDIKKIMETVLVLEVPLTVRIELGNNWLDMEEVDLVEMKKTGKAV